MEDIRDELAACVDLIGQGSAAAAATRLTKLRWRLEQVDRLPESSRPKPQEGEGPALVDEAGAPLFAWEFEGSIHPTRRSC